MTPSLVRTTTMIFDAAIKPELWSAALSGVAAIMGAEGAAYIVRDKQTRRVEWACLTGPSIELTQDYLGHYAALDPYLPLQEKRPIGQWLQLHQCLSPRRLQRDEWYNDFVLKSGVVDVVGTQLFDSPSHSVVIGLHRIKGQNLDLRENLPAISELMEPLRKAAALYLLFRKMELRLALTAGTLEQLSTGIILTDARGRIVELNRAAERILRTDDGLTMRGGQLCAKRTFEASRLTAMIAAAAGNDRTKRAAGRMLVARHAGSRSYVVAVTAISKSLSRYKHNLAIVLIADPNVHVLTEQDLTDCFGVSRAEARLAAALMTGKRLADIATESDLRMSTLRSQLSSVLHKLGVKRQSDLIGMLADARLVGLAP